LGTQDDLFSTEASSLCIDTTFTTAKRLAIDDRSWIEVVPGWMSGAQLLFDRLTTAVPWRQHDRRRRPLNTWHSSMVPCH
jgi:hypothetical protein